MISVSACALWACFLYEALAMAQGTVWSFSPETMSSGLRSAVCGGGVDLGVGPRVDVHRGRLEEISDMSKRDLRVQLRELVRAPDQCREPARPDEPPRQTPSTLSTFLKVLRGPVTLGTG